MPNTYDPQNTLGVKSMKNPVQEFEKTCLICFLEVQGDVQRINMERHINKCFNTEKEIKST